MNKLKEFVENNVINKGDSLCINGLMEYECNADMSMSLQNGLLNFYDPDLVKAIHIGDIDQIEIIHRDGIKQIAGSVLYDKKMEDENMEENVEFKFDIDDLIEQLIDLEVDHYIESDREWHPFEDTEDIMIGMFSCTIDYYGDIVTIEEIIKTKEFKEIEKEVKKISDVEIDDINNTIVEECEWKNEIPNNYWRNK